MMNEHNTTKRNGRLILALCLCALLMLIGLPALADEGTVTVQYTGGEAECIPITSDMMRLENNWYVVNANVSTYKTMNVVGDVNLILVDGYTLNTHAVWVNKGNSLTIWGQDLGTGKLNAVSWTYKQAAIGGCDADAGTIIINGGTVNASAGYDGGEWEGSAGIGAACNHQPGTVIINGGTVTATGGDCSAGIGGARIDSYTRVSSAGRIEIHGGTVNATGKYGGAGIGSGKVGNHFKNYNAVGTILITGGTIHAKGSADSSLVIMLYSAGAGIGGGSYSTAGNITITGGTIDACGEFCSPGIGCCGLLWENGGGGTINISGGTIVARRYLGAEYNSAGIGGGSRCGNVKINISGGTIIAMDQCNGIGDGPDSSGGSVTTLSWTEESKDTMSVQARRYTGTVVVENPFVVTNNNNLVFPTESLSNRGAIGNKVIVPWDDDLQYLDPDNGLTDIQYGYTMITDSTASLSSGWYVVGDEITNENRLAVTGDVNLILADGAALNLPKGISVPSGQTLTIWAQSTDSDAGTLTVSAPDAGNAGIGGTGGLGGTVVINGGIINVTGGSGAADIGGGVKDGAVLSAEGVTIRGGQVTANAGGIGGCGGLTNTPITLGYGEVTVDSVSVNATYSGDVHFACGFQSADFAIPEGLTLDGCACALNGVTATAWTGSVFNTWALVQKGLNSGLTVALADDVTAGAGEAPITIPAGTVSTLDLNGHTLSRGLTAAAAEGYVLKVLGNLTVTDSAGGGVITGGKTTGDGGGIWNEGTLTLMGGTISGNIAQGNGGGIYMKGVDDWAYVYFRGGSITGNTSGSDGGGIYIDNAAKMTMTSGSVTGNTSAGNGGGIYYGCWNSAFYAYGAPEVTGNTTAAGGANNLYLGSYHLANDINLWSNILVEGAFSDGANLGVTTALAVTDENPVTVTDGFSEHNATLAVRYIHSDAGYEVGTTDGEATLQTERGGAGFYVNHAWDSFNGYLFTNERYETNAVKYTGSTTVQPGWYYVDGTVNVNGRVSFTGDTSLILNDGCTLDVKGLYIPNGSTLTIYGQTEGTGRIYSHPDDGSAIGGYRDHDNGNIVIHGGTIDATGHDHCAGIGSNDDQNTGTITIYGGTVTANGGSQGAGIGGGRYTDGSTIIIYGGSVTATGGDDGAGIGGGQDGSNNTIKIYGGTVIAKGTDSSAGIGGGDPSSSKATNATVEIYGGTVVANGDSKGAGIGGGEYGHGTITISGGDVIAVGGYKGGAGVGSGVDGTGSTITISGGRVRANAYDGGAGIGNGNNSSTGTVVITGGVIEARGDANGLGCGTGNSNPSCNISIGYTDETKDTISVTTTNIIGTVTLTQPMQQAQGNFHTFFSVGEAALATDLVGTLVSWDGEIDTWRELQQAISGAPDGSTITLDRDYTATPPDYALTIPTSLTSLTIDLNGHTLDRNLGSSNAREDGSVIVNLGDVDLTIQNGTLTGGKTTGKGGGIYNAGTLRLNNVTLRNNTAADGGGLYNAAGEIYTPTGAEAYLTNVTIQNNTATQNGGGGIVNAGQGVNGWAGLLLTNCTISGNTSQGRGGGIYNGGIMKYSGTVTITGNRSNSTGGGVYHDIGVFTAYEGAVLKIQNNTAAVDCPDLYLADEAPAGRTLLKVEGSLGAGSMIGVGTPSMKSVFTSGWTEENTDFTQYFYPSTNLNLPGVSIRQNSDKQAELYYTANYYDPVSNQTKTTISNNLTIMQDGATTLATGWYYVGGKVTVYDRMTVDGMVNLILADGAELSAQYGITVSKGNALTIWGQEASTGKLRIDTNLGSGIGGVQDTPDAGAITINGGDVRSITSGQRSAGIGGGWGGSGGTIVINHGTVYAKGGLYAAGIGGGDDGASGDITINGGNVTAIGGNYGAGIGSGGGAVNSITITGGTVNATNPYYEAAGIGGGYWGGGGTITITGGQITAKGDSGYDMGIGNGRGSHFGDTNIFIDCSSAYMTVQSTGYTGQLTLGHAYKDTNHDNKVYDAGVVSDKKALRNSWLIPTDAVAVTFDRADERATGTMEPVPMMINSEYTLPACGFQLATYSFTGWSVQIGEAEAVTMQPGDVITMTADVLLTATWDSDEKLWIGGEYITESGRDILGDMTVTYDKSTHTLMLTGADITAADASQAVIEATGISKLTVLYHGASVLTSAGAAGISVDGDLIITGDGNLTIEGASGSGITAPGSISVQGTGILTVNGGGSAPAISGGTLTIADNLAITTPVNGEVSGGNSPSGTVVIKVPQLFTITLADTQHGLITADAAEATPGTTITLHVVPDTGYRLDVITITDAAGSVITSTAQTTIYEAAAELDISELTGIDSTCLTMSRTECTFIMPEANVTVSAAFTPASTLTFIPGDDGVTGAMDEVTVTTGAAYTLPACGFTAPAGAIFRAWSVAIGDAEGVTMAPGDEITVTADTTVTALWVRFGPATFTMPAALKTIEESAFEGMTNLTIVDASSVTSIGANAFKDSGLTQIRLTQNCAIDATAFEGCATVYVFAPAGGTTVTSCAGIANCVFVPAE